jgi:hypothetical protein
MMCQLRSRFIAIQLSIGPLYKILRKSTEICGKRGLIHSNHHRIVSQGSEFALSKGDSALWHCDVTALLKVVRIKRVADFSIIEGGKK